MFKPTIKNFNINFNTSNERSRFFSGDLISGQISFELSKETSINALTLTLEGRADVHWSRSSGSGKRKSRRHFYAKLEFFKLKYALVEDSVTHRATRFPPGTHMYPFSCQIPRGDFPSSFQGPHGRITYTLTVGIRRPWRLSKDFATQLNFVNRTDMNQPELLAPLAGTNSMTLCCWWFASGPITMTVQLDKKAFVPGETVKIGCEFSNASSRTATPKVRLCQKQTVYTQNKANRNMYEKNLVSVTGPPVSPHRSNVNTDIMLTIPSDAQLTISNCSIIEVDYIIRVSFSVKGSPNLDVLCPIILCEPLACDNPPPYM